MYDLKNNFLLITLKTQNKPNSIFI